MISCFLKFKDVSQNSLEHWNDVSGAESAEQYDGLSEKRRTHNIEDLIWGNAPVALRHIQQR